MQTKDLLFEIGAEEIPARFLPGTLERMESLAEDTLQKKGLRYNALRVFATPRRLTYMVLGLATAQTDRETEVKGPSLSAAFDAEGNPSKALLGFCRSQGTDAASLIQKQIGSAVYVHAVKSEQGRPTKEVLPEVFDLLITGLSFPKPMRWSGDDMRFVRPIRWLAAIYGDEVIPYRFGLLTADRISRGHRAFCPNGVSVSSAETYLISLSEAYVIADQEARKSMIRLQIDKLAGELNGIVDRDEELLEEVSNLVEYPTAFYGSFDRKYLALPAELVTTPMKEHQRYFPVYDVSGALMPYFMAVRNGDEHNIAAVIGGNESVLHARLADAEFFWQEDKKTALADNFPRLENIVFQEKIGTVAQKVRRVRKFAAYLGRSLGFSEPDLLVLDRAALLSKCDLVTRAVGEFPELQGIMGEYYALQSGESAAAAKAVREHYLPRFAADFLPQSLCGCVLAIADKMDSTIGLFGIGLQPSGSQDPYALRRAAGGCAQIMVDHNLNLPLMGMIEAAYSLFEDVRFDADSESIKVAVYMFFRQRIERMLEERGIRYDEISAVLEVGFDDMPLTVKRARALNRARAEQVFLSVITGYTRSAKLAAKEPLQDESRFDRLLLTDKSEIVLFDEAEKVREEVSFLMEREDYFNALLVFGKLGEYIDRFFEEVMVMTDDLALRRNRQLLLKEIAAIPAGIADLSRLVF